MSEFSDEQLSAFLDDALAPEDRLTLAEALVEDAALAQRLEALRGADALFTDTLSAIDKRPLPEGLEAMLDAADTDERALPKAANDNVVWRSIAASVALVAAFAAGGLLDPFGTDDKRTPARFASLTDDPRVQSMLENDASGTRAELDNGQSAEARLSFLGTQGNYCREFAVGDSERSSEVVACRSHSEGWEVVLAAAGPALIDQSGGYATASDGNAAFDAAVSTLMASDSADRETEKRWIENGWQDAP